MNSLTTLNASETLTMSSKEIAELTGRRHDNVLRDINNLAEELSLSFEEKAEASGGRPSKVYLLPKRETLVLVSGYSAVMRAAIIDRWQALEAQAKPAFALPQTFGEALMLAGKLEQERQALALTNSKQAEVIAIAAPKAEFFDELVENKDVYSPTQAAQLLAVKDYNTAQKVNTLMCSLDWQYKRGKDWVAKAAAIANGFLQAKIFTNGDTGFSSSHVRITPLGLDALRHQIKA